MKQSPLFRFNRLQNRLAFWFLALVFLTLVVLASLSYRNQVRSIKDMAFAKLTAVRDLKARELKNWFEERRGDLLTASQDLEIRGLSQLTEGGSYGLREDPIAVETARQLFGRVVKNYVAFSEVYLVNASTGRVMLSTNRASEGVDESESRVFQGAITARDFYFTDIHWSSAVRGPSASVSIPVYCLAHNREHLSGVLVGRLDLERSLYPLLLNTTGFGATGETLIVNRDGLALNELKYRSNAPLNLVITAEPALRGARGETGLIEIADYRGVDVLAAYTHIPLTGWGLVSKQDQSEVYAPISDLIRGIGVSALLAILTAVLVVGVLGRSLSRPVREIAEVSRKIEHGDLSARGQVRGQDEIASLAASINAMAAALEAADAARRNSAAVTDALLRARTTEQLAHEILDVLLGSTGGVAGAFCLRNSASGAYELVEVVGAQADFPQSFDPEEGQLQRAIRSGRIIREVDIGPDTIVIHPTIAGSAVPREIVTIPVTVQGQPEAAVMLASLAGFNEGAQRFFESAQRSLAAGLGTLIAIRAKEQLAAELQATNTELTRQSSELMEQTEELKELAEELRRQRQEVEEASRLKSQFLANMSHELRTPLNSVLALSQLMLDQDSSQDREYLEVIERNGRHLLDLINDLLDLSKIEAGRMTIQLESILVADLVASVEETIAPLAADKGLKFDIESDAEIGTLRSDRDKIRRILLNLLTNAVKFTDTGSVRLSVRRTGEQVTFAVEDTGIGIGGKDIEAIFEEFKQVDGTATRRFGGTGLGLAISRQLAALLGGGIRVESQVGQGSIFVLTVPAQASQESGGTGPEPRRADTGTFRAAKRQQVLIVDDDEIIRLQLTTFLEAEGYTVTAVAGGREALQICAERQPDAIVLDLAMPEMSGFEVLRDLRSQPDLASVPVLVLTACELTADDLAELRFNGVHQLVQKGTVNRELLLQYVARLFEGQSRQGEFRRIQRSGPILVVEDSADNLLTVTAILDEWGWSWASAGNGREAIDTARAIQPALILMDMHLPVMSGLEATRAISGDPELQDTPVVALTANAMDGDRERFMAAGCVDYLVKPVDSGRLKALIESLVEPTASQDSDRAGQEGGA